MADVLIVEDKPSFGEMLKASLEDAGLSCQWARTGREALALFKKEKFSTGVLDLRLPDTDGIALLRQLLEIDGDTRFVVMTAFGSIERAVEAMKLGARDFLTKPFGIEDLITGLKRLLDERRCVFENELFKEQYAGMPEIIGRSSAINRAVDMLKKVAPTDTTVLLLGESGTGKELFARACHMLSPRREQPFVAINCAAIPRELLENELFGSERGAFTGAHARKLGKFEVADKGTLLLDEIGDLNLDLQAKILRVLQEKTFERLGGTVAIRVDVRVVVASNQDLLALVKDKRFREDLYYRIGVFPIQIPSLRERPDDIPLLAEHFLMKNHSDRQLSAAAMEKLTAYAWPGNIRELENTIERAVILSSAVIEPEHILLPDAGGPMAIIVGRDLKTAGEQGRRHAEAALIRTVLQDTGNNKAEAARRLGVSYKTLLHRITEYRGLKLL